VPGGAELEEARKAARHRAIIVTTLAGDPAWRPQCRHFMDPFGPPVLKCRARPGSGSGKPPIGGQKRGSWPRRRADPLRRTT
jgi:hypothetical protein